MVDLRSTRMDGEMMKEINLGVSDGEAFYAHELSINFNPAQFFFDFKCITPRVDMRSKERPTVHVKHNLIMSDPYHAKEILKLLTRVVENYEKQFGEIKKLDAVKKHEKKYAKDQKESKKDETTPSYFG